MSRSELLAFARTGMAVRPPSTPEQVEELVRSFAALPILSEPVDEATIMEIARQLEREFAVSLGRSHTLANDHRPWLRAKSHAIDFRYWRRYRDFLIQQGFGVNVSTRCPISRTTTLTWQAIRKRRKTGPGADLSWDTCKVARQQTISA